MNLSDFKKISLRLASPEEILKWSYGEVLKPETINYRTQRFERDGLFAENIFGPSRDFECYCGKYKRIRYKGVICDKCGVEVTRSSVRRERMGHIKLAVPVSHIWFLRNVPSKLGLILNLPANQLEKVIYFAAYIITEINEGARQSAGDKINEEFKSRAQKEENKKQIKKLEALRERAKEELKSLKPLRIMSELEYRQYSLKYGQVFKAGIGAEAILKILEKMDLKAEIKDIKKRLQAKRAARPRLLRRLHIFQSLLDNQIRPEWMGLVNLPVISPDLRPLVQLDGGRFATSDLNDLYRRIINRNNRLKRLLDLGAPEVICRNEKRMLQEAVDALIDNASRKSQTEVSASTGQRRALRSLADMLRGKQGRFRQNLLGKRVDYSGRSVIVVGPELALSEVGIPKRMALEIFRPFVIQKLIQHELAHNVRSAGKVIEEEGDEVWDFLEEVTKNRYVLLNRAPTLHRLGIQAFKPILIEGKAIELHPLVCAAFNADFDGDQMAVHLPLTEKAQAEAQELMLSSSNLLKPATGKPIVNPEKDIVFGVYYLTSLKNKARGEGKIFSGINETIMAYEKGLIDLRAEISFSQDGKIIKSSVGRILFNQILPPEINFINEKLNKAKIRDLVEEVLQKTDHQTQIKFLDNIKKLGFHYATVSGFSWSMCDLKELKNKDQILKDANRKVKIIQEQFEEGLLTDRERYSRVIEVWFGAKNKIAEEVKASVDPESSVYAMIDSKARGSWELLNQMMGIKGLVVNPSGQIIEMPITSSFKEGFKTLEYFLSTHGTRKGMADTAIRTATAGYLTRRLVDVAQDVIIQEKDCGTKNGIHIGKKDLELLVSYKDRLLGRVKAGAAPEVIDKNNIGKFLSKKINQVRSPVTCETRHGICQLCYGYDLGRNKLVELGEAVGVVTAQAIGEPGTQLTLRTFHSGGVAGGGDITQGLPRVEELFEARIPKGQATISDVDGAVFKIEDREDMKIVKVKRKGKKQIKDFVIPPGFGLKVSVGENIARGQALSEGSINLYDLFKFQGLAGLVRYITREIQLIYTAEGTDIADKYIEIIIRQMLSRVEIKDPGDTDLLPGDIVEKDEWLEANELLGKNKKRAEAEELLLGITKVSLTTTSWLSAASFQETTKVLVNSAIKAKEDTLRGLKENVIVGKLIPAGTGFKEK